MLKRIITGVTLVATVFAAILLAYFVNPVFLDIYMLLWIATAVYEMIKCFKNSGYTIHKTPLILMTLLVYPVFYLMEFYLGIGLQGIVILFIFTVAIQLFIFTLGNQEKNTLQNLQANIFITVYPLFILSFAFVISYKFFGIYSITMAMFLPIFADTFAYFVGSTIKGKKLCPTISPKKTVAGALGGILGAMIASVLFYLFFEYFNVLPKIGYIPFISHTIQGWEWKTALIYLAIGFSIGILSELCDLVASRIKRELKIKDYGNIFPGHGGAMDRLDSIISSILVLLVAFTAIYGF